MNWKETYLKYVARLEYGDSLPSEQDERQGEIQVYGSNGPYAEYSIANTKSPVIIIGRKGSYGKVNWSEKPVYASDTTFFIDERYTSHNLRWIYYLLLTLDLDVGTNEAAVPGLNREFAYSKKVLIPSPSEQKAIAAYLDEETAHIDALIAEFENMLDELAEKRISVISHAMRHHYEEFIVDENFEPLSLPSNWKIISLKYLSRYSFQYGANEAADQDDPDNPRYIRISDIKDDGTLHKDTFKSLPFDVAEPYILEDGDILFARSGATVGKTFLYRSDMGIACYAGYLIRFRPNQEVLNPSFLKYFTESKQYWGWIGSRIIQATIQNVSAEKYANLELPVPPIDEQREIVEYLDIESNKIRNLQHEVNESIDLLKERRIALISAAVTGKIRIKK